MSRPRRTAVLARALATDQAVGLLRRAGVLTIRSGQAAHGDAGAAADYAINAFAGLSRWGRLDAVRELRVLEVGPGDNLGLGLVFLAHGAASVVAADRFAVRRDEALQRRIYAEIARRLPGAAGERAAALLEDGRPPIDLHSGVSVEEIDRALPPASFDLIVSVAVAEHLYDVRQGLTAMSRVLAPGGRMLHQVDLRDHGIFTGAGLPALEFLTVPDRVYRRISHHTGRPNRTMAGAYRSILDELGLEHELLATWVAGQPRGLDEYVPRLRRGEHFGEDEAAAVAAIRPRLLPRYAAMSDEDLLTAGIFVSARRPA